MDRTDEDRANRMTVWRDVDGTTHVECRLTFSVDDIAGDHLTASDRAFLREFDRPDASPADRLMALSILVEARTRQIA